MTFIEADNGTAPLKLNEQQQCNTLHALQLSSPPLTVCTCVFCEYVRVKKDSGCQLTVHCA